MTEPAFEVRDVTFRYQGVTALDGLSLRIGHGRRVALLGANGSGKSTLLRVLDALYFPEAGEVRAFGARLDEAALAEEADAFAFRRRVGMVFQNPDVQLFNATVFDELAFGPLQLKWPRARILDAVHAMLAHMGIGHLKDRPPHRLSGGEKKKVALASVLILDPEVLLLDEPTASLDPESQSQLIETMIGWGGGAKTMVLATHDIDIVEDVADVCLVMQHGRLVAEGAPADILYDVELLRRTGLIHAHRHSHDGQHSHLHHHLHRARLG
ncbi:ABC transporter ATP-binding protein [Parasulfuritortus cantonensis]|uniref:ABC transporter ATP-binding protein n=1 Tax=Parasulfuritortus cantonensis TaxID=2528202 RepID=A0A4R1BNI4_9PROT|nr:ABC transporter ATP-binding protein [Parasulfuritortus cantonensis]TCJ18917.1 ABC transporter ATP-binding protein [Parasulfuritortus cantonensis]